MEHIHNNLMKLGGSLGNVPQKRVIKTRKKEGGNMKKKNAYIR
jgi:hypothetical protein